MEYGLIATKLGHSFSPAIHAQIGDYDYRLREIKEEDLASFMKEKDFKGINVTIPYKTAVMPYLDHIDEKAKKIGSVNTVCRVDGRLYGYNTDYDGLKMLVLRLYADVKGKKALVLGSGGTAKTAREVLCDLGAEEVYFVRRDRKEGALTYGDVYKNHADASILVNTTPCGMYPHAGELPTDEEGRPLDLDAFPHLEAVVDVVFNPLRTALVIEAQKRSIKAEGGLYMLCAQGVFAAGHFFEKEYDISLIDRIYTQLLVEKTNVVLCGMPGCGKTTLGKMLSSKRNRPFFDVDECIVEEEQRSIPEIFRKEGEEYFRRIESQVIARLSEKNGAVISLGGGSILKQENVDAIKRNGLLCFIDRPLSEIAATSDRPLSDTLEKLNALYEKRYPLYSSSADCRFINDQTAEKALEEIDDKIFGM